MFSKREHELKEKRSHFHLPPDLVHLFPLRQKKLNTTEEAC